MKNYLKVLKDIIEHFKKELINTELLSQRYFEIKDKIIKEEYAALETIDYILYKIYVKKELKPFCKKSIFEKLLNKLTTECVFSGNNRLIKQIDGCPMGGPISVVLSDIYVCKMEEDIVAPSKPLFYKRYVDDTYVRRKKNETDELLPPNY